VPSLRELTIPACDLEVTGNFEPLISQQLFDQVQDVLQERNAAATTHNRSNTDFPLRVFVRCGVCGSLSIL
jgi:hypothetical protein